MILALAKVQNWLWYFARQRVILSKEIQARLNCLPGFEPHTQAFRGV